MNINNKNKTEFRSLIKKKIKTIQDKMNFHPKKVFIVTEYQESDEMELDKAIDLAYEYYLDNDDFSIRKEIGIKKPYWIEIDYIRAVHDRGGKYSVVSDVILMNDKFDETVLAVF